MNSNNSSGVWVDIPSRLSHSDSPSPPRDYAQAVTGMCLEDVNHDLLNLLPSVVELKNGEFQTAEQNLAELERSVWKLKQKLEDARAWKPVANGQPEDEMLCAQQKSAQEAFDQECIAFENAKVVRECARVALEKAEKDWEEYKEKHNSSADDSLLDGEIRGNEEVNEEGDDSSDSADEEVNEEVDDDSLLDGEIRGNDEEVNEEVNDDSLLDGEIRGNDEEDGSRENEDDSSDSADEEGNEEVNEEGDDGSSENDTPLSTKQRKRRRRRENAKKRRKTDRPVQKQPQIAPPVVSSENGNDETPEQNTTISHQLDAFLDDINTLITAQPPIAQPDVSSENGNNEAVGNTQSLPSFLKQELHSTEEENEKIKQQLNAFMVEMNTVIAAQQQELNDIKDGVQSPDEKLFEIILCSCLACAAAPSLQAPFLNNKVINAESLLVDLIGYDKSNDTYTEEECQKAVHSAKTILHMAEE